MTSIAIGASGVANLKETESCVMATNGGFFQVTTSGPNPSTVVCGPEAMRRSFGPFGVPGGVTLTVKNQSCDLLLVASRSDSVISPVASPQVQKLRRAIAAAKTFNPYDAAEATDAPTVSGTHDASLTFTNCDPAAATTAAKMNLFGGRWTKDGANSRWVAIADTVTPGTPGAMSCIEFSTDAPKVEIRTSAGTIYIEVDGYAIAKAGTVVSGAGQQQAVLDYTAGTGRKTRRYRVWSNTLIYHYSIGVDSVSRLWAPQRDDAVLLYVEGDSYMLATVADGAAATTTIPNKSMVGIFAMRAGIRNLWVGAEGGTGYITQGTKFSNYQLRAPSVIAASPDAVLIFGSINDNNLGQAAVYAAALPYYRRLRTALPGVPIIVFGAEPGSTGPSAALLSVEAGIKQAVTEMADPLMAFVPISSDTPSWGDASNQSVYIGAFDNTHPTEPAGCQYYADRIYHGFEYALSQMLGV